MPDTRLSRFSLGIGLAYEAVCYDKTGPRYFAVTGDKTDLSTNDISKIDDPEKIALLHFMVLHLHDTKLTRLWMGDTSAYDNDDSSADFALMRELAKFTQNDPVRTEKFFSASVLGRRDKWIDRADYRQRTVKAALDNQQQAESTNIQSSSRELVFRTPAAGLGSEKDYVMGPEAGKRDSEGCFPPWRYFYDIGSIWIKKPHARISF